MVRGRDTQSGLHSAKTVRLGGASLAPLTATADAGGGVGGDAACTGRFTALEVRAVDARVRARIAAPLTSQHDQLCRVCHNFQCGGLEVRT